MRRIELPCPSLPVSTACGPEAGHIRDLDRLGESAERRFRAVEKLFETQRRHGVLRRRQVPRRVGTTVSDQCERVLVLARTLRDHGLSTPHARVDGAESLARRILEARAALGAQSATVIGDTAATLSGALATHRATAAHASIEDSGVFAVAELWDDAPSGNDAPAARCA